MPTPDKTMDDVSKLVSDARHNGCAGRHKYWNSGYDPMCRRCDANRVCDALESVAKERDALREALAKMHSFVYCDMECRRENPKFEQEGHWPDCTITQAEQIVAALAAQSKP